MNISHLETLCAELPPRLDHTVDDSGDREDVNMVFPELAEHKLQCLNIRDKGGSSECDEEHATDYLMNLLKFLRNLERVSIYRPAAKGVWYNVQGAKY